jgi:pyrroloquinoline quinone biosynthesis protein B
VIIRILGSAAGGGFPQWNCNCPNCAGFRAGSLRAQARSQSSIAVAAGPAWVLVNASPDVRAQLQANPAFQPNRGLRDSAIEAIVLVDGQVDHTTGLYMLRESTHPWDLWCTESTHADLTRGNPILGVLGFFCGIAWHPIELQGEAFRIDKLPGVSWRAIPVASKPAPYSPNRSAPLPGDNVALIIEDEASGASLLYAPGLGSIDAPIWAAMQAADCVLVDGTFWRDDEMQSVGVSRKRARDLGHLPQSGAGGMLEWLQRLPRATRKILVHINNTNPILDEDSAERAELARLGVEVAWDGMEISL